MAGGGRKRGSPPPYLFYVTHVGAASIKCAIPNANCGAYYRYQIKALKVIPVKASLVFFNNLQTSYSEELEAETPWSVQLWDFPSSIRVLLKQLCTREPMTNQQNHPAADSSTLASQNHSMRPEL